MQSPFYLQNSRQQHVHCEVQKEVVYNSLDITLPFDRVARQIHYIAVELSTHMDLFQQGTKYMILKTLLLEF